MPAGAARVSDLAGHCGRILVDRVLYRDVIWIALGLIFASWLWQGMRGGAAWPGMVTVLCAIAVAVELQRSRKRICGWLAAPLALSVLVSPFFAGGISMVAAIMVVALVVGVRARMEDDRCLYAAAFMLSVTALSEFFSGIGADVVGQFLLESETALLGTVLALAGYSHQIHGSALLLPDRQVVLLTECSSFVLIAEAGALTLALGRLLRVPRGSLLFVLFAGATFTASLNFGRLMAMLLSPVFYGQLHNDLANQAMGFAICSLILVLLFPARGRGV